MNKHEKATAAKRLADDAALQLAFSEILESATRVFLDAASTMESREQAHQDVRSIEALRRKLRLWISEQAIAEDKIRKSAP